MEQAKPAFDPDKFATIVSQRLVADLGLEGQYFGPPRQWQRTWTPLDPVVFKKHYQVTEFLKKFSFSKDEYTPLEVEEMTKEKFLANQQRIGTFEPDMSDLVRDALFRAKGWIENLLGDYDLEEHLQMCYWPKRSSVGCPRTKATLGNRWMQGLTGSRYHLDWFERIYMPFHTQCDDHNDRHPPGSEFCFGELLEVDALHAVLVNKTYKSKRMILPNTGIGGLYTNGLGAVIVKRLNQHGYDVRKLPDRHKVLARRASYNGDSATVDQTLASDNITTWLLEKSFPLRWAKALLAGRIGRIELDGVTHETKTLSTMGIGYTFPVQMVLFLGLAHASLSIYQETFGKVRNPTISVFGDDLICPVEIKNILTDVFESLGLLINEEKSFWCGPFRESCGGDYFRGLDVRPAYLPRWEGSVDRKRSVEAYLYKTYNAVMRRWTEDELPTTVQFILSQLKMLCRENPYVVPPSFGDDTGLKVSLDQLATSDLRAPKRDIHGSFKFDRLENIPATQNERFQDAHYWESLRRSFSDDCSPDYAHESVARSPARHRHYATWENIPVGKQGGARSLAHHLLFLRHWIPEVPGSLVLEGEKDYRAWCCAGKRGPEPGTQVVVALSDDGGRYSSTRSQVAVWT